MKVESFRYALFVFLILISSTFEKRSSKTIYLQEFIEHNTQTKFLTKFDFGIGLSNITIRYRKLSKDPTISFNLKIGLLTDDNFEKFKLPTVCSQKEKLYNQTYKLTFYDSHQGTQFLRINETQRERIWFIYVYTCDNVANVKVHEDAALLFQVSMLNVESNLGEDQKIVGPYIGLMLLWLILLFKIMIPIVKSLARKPTTAQTMLYCGYLILGLAIFYRLIQIISKQYTGEDIMVFVYLHLIFKFIIQGLMVALLISIAWGWSLIHTKFDFKYALLSSLMVIINISCFLIWHNSEQIDESYLIYEDKTGIIILIVRCAVFLVFIVGCLRSSVAFVGKRKYFIEYYAKLGSAYLLAWPITVILAKVLFPRYMVNEIVTITEEAVHMLMNAYICWLFAYPDSSYKKISIKDEDSQASMGIMPTYRY